MLVRQCLLYTKAASDKNSQLTQLIEIEFESPRLTLVLLLGHRRFLVCIGA